MAEPEDDLGFEEDDFGFEEDPAEPSMEAMPTGEMPASVPEGVELETEAPKQPGRLPFTSRAFMGGLLGGWADELGAYAQSLGSGEEYEDVLARERALQAEEIAAKPGVKTLGRIYQGAATTALPGSGIPAMVGQGAALGALEAAGESDADSLEGRLRAGGQGAATGAGAALALGGAGKALGAAGRKLLKRGAEKTVEGIGSTPTELRKLLAKHGSAEEVGELMRRSGITGSPAQMADRARAVADVAGERIGDVYRQADEAFGGMPVASLQRVRSGLQGKLDELSEVHGTEEAQRIVQQAIKRIRKEGLSPGADATIPQMHKHVQSLAEGAQKKAFESAQRRAADDVAGVYRTELQDVVGQASPEILEQLRDANKLYSLTQDIIPAAEGEVSRLGTGKSGTLRELMASGVGMAATGSPLGAAAGLLDKPVRKFGKAAAASAMRGAGHAASGTGAVAQRLAPASRTAAAEAARETVRSSTDMAREALRSNPLAFGVEGARLQQAAAQGDREFAAEHWRAMMNSEEYRQKMRELEAREMEKK